MIPTIAAAKAMTVTIRWLWIYHLQAEQGGGVIWDPLPGASLVDSGV